VRSRLFGLGLLLIAPAALPALAYASPADPVWVHGVYDDGDHDDVVWLATAAAADLAPPEVPHPPANVPPVSTVPLLAESAPHPAAASAVCPRAPPAA
jgi:hypothetical protein